MAVEDQPPEVDRGPERVTRVILARSLASGDDLQAFRGDVERRLTTEYELLSKRLAGVEDELRSKLNTFEARLQSAEGVLINHSTSHQNWAALHGHLAKEVESWGSRLEEERLASSQQTQELAELYQRCAASVESLQADHSPRLDAIEKALQQSELDHAGFAKAVSQDLHSLRDGLHESSVENRAKANEVLEDCLAGVVDHLFASTEPEWAVAKSLFPRAQAAPGETQLAANPRAQADRLAAVLACGLATHRQALQSEAKTGADKLRSEINTVCEALRINVHSETAATCDAFRAQLSSSHAEVEESIQRHHQEVKEIWAHIEALNVKGVEKLIQDLEVQIWPWRSARRWAQNKEPSPAMDLTRPMFQVPGPRPLSARSTSRPQSASTRKQALNNLGFTI